MDRCKLRTSVTWPGFGMIVLLLVSGLFFPFSSEAVITTRVSVASDGSQGNGGPTTRTSISADGRFVAFDSDDSNLVPGNTNGRHIFVHDRQTGQTTLVSVASDGTQANHSSYYPFISADGRFVAFESDASNLVPGDNNGLLHIFVHDRQTGQTTRVSVTSDGTLANHHSYHPSISADGRFVAFESYASNLVFGDTTASPDIFVHDRQTGQTSRVSVALDGTQSSGEGPSISANGRFVAFYSYSPNLVPGDTNGRGDGFVHDRQTGQTTRVSVASDGAQGNDASGAGSISADGRFVAFGSDASNLVSGDTNGQKDIFVHDRQTGQTSRVSVASDGTQANLNSFSHSISADGRFVAFESYASNLVPGDTNGKYDIFVHDRQTGQTSRVSVASDGTQGNNNSFDPSISSDGSFVAYDSLASNLVPGDTNGVHDVFLSRIFDWGATTTTTTNMTENSATLNGIIFPNGSATTYYFEWGTTQAYGNVTGSQSAGSGSGDVAVSANLTGLTPNRAYHYRLAAVNNVGATGYGSDKIFRTRIAGGDLTGDGKAEIFWRHGATGQVYLWLMDGVSSAGHSSLGSVGLSWEIMGIHDFNGDGKADILWRHAVSGQIYLWLMDGTSLAGQGSAGSAGLSWEIMGVHDFNGDGKADILWRQAATGQVYLWLMDGISPAGQGTIDTVDPSWEIVGAGDFNGDGKADILWRHATTGQIYIWLMDGTTITSRVSPWTVGDLTWAIKGVGDFDGDGKADILWQHAASGQVFIWLMDGSTITSMGSPWTVGDLNWDIKGVRDFNGDGKADILWQHNASGQIFVWLMDGTGISSVGSPGTVPDLGWGIRN